MQNMRITQGIKKTQRQFPALKVWIRGLSTLKGGHVKIFFYWLSVHYNVCASQSSMFLFQWITFCDTIFNASQRVIINTLI
jgi:hypothetical protein